MENTKIETRPPLNFRVRALQCCVVHVSFSSKGTARKKMDLPCLPLASEDALVLWLLVDGYPEYCTKIDLRMLLCVDSASSCIELR
mmetsp:Transcript_6159/g.10545  ORF Transcript_6159/g.10545 Transcript_6159/m.10545 type:complete len:86 (-) Transcript_6159:268-525(-)